MGGGRSESSTHRGERSLEIGLPVPNACGLEAEAHYVPLLFCRASWVSEAHKVLNKIWRVYSRDMSMDVLRQGSCQFNLLAFVDCWPKNELHFCRWECWFVESSAEEQCSFPGVLSRL